MTPPLDDSDADELTNEALVAFLTSIATTVLELDRVPPQDRTSSNFRDRLRHLIDWIASEEGEDQLRQSDKEALHKLHRILAEKMKGPHPLWMIDPPTGSRWT